MRLSDTLSTSLLMLSATVTSCSTKPRHDPASKPAHTLFDVTKKTTIRPEYDVTRLEAAQYGLSPDASHEDVTREYLSRAQSEEIMRLRREAVKKLTMFFVNVVESAVRTESVSGKPDFSWGILRDGDSAEVFWDLKAIELGLPPASTPDEILQEIATRALNGLEFGE